MPNRPIDSILALAILATLGWLANIVRNLIPLLHILQLEEYQTGRYLRWLVDDPIRAVRLPRLVAAVASLVIAATALVSGVAGLAVAVGVAIWGGIGVALAVTDRRPPAKKPLQFTARAKATLGIATTLGAGLIALAAWVIRPTALGMILGASLASLLAGPLLALANLAFVPAQYIARERILRQARAKIRSHNVTVVGITGSYGKTSTKEILASLLGTKYKVLKTPESFNTPLGVARAIINDLQADHEFFVVEMGAYGVGEIRKLCQLTGPRIGVLTAVNPQHLERFGSVENTARAKYELIESLPPDGTAIFNNDNEWCRRLAERTTVRTIRYGLEPAPNLDLTASDVETTRVGIAFTMSVAEHEPVRVDAGLLGRHNAGNILAAAAAALACGMTPAEIAKAALHIEAVPHRLQLITGAGGVTVIDDSYNANPDGVRAALAVLREYPGKKKVLVTPGMIELGDREAEENRRFGQAAAAVCDAIILVGPRRTEPIQMGLADSGYPPDRTTIVRGVAEATERLKTILAPGDVVLFANDLPDTYDEAP